jgi:putative protease
MKNKVQNKIELLAPAGNMEKMKTAFLFGADAVYLGIPDFSLRVRINDFDVKSIKIAADYAHKLNKKVYATINIFAHNPHLSRLPVYIKKLKQIKIDALIISDPGVLELVKKVWPKVEIHLSTQANCTNWQAAKFWYKQGVKRVILGREVTLMEIQEIHKQVPKLELEYFIHGAMCMAYSGRCFLSSYFVGRSANLGDCVQPCRWLYQVKSKKGKVESKGEQIFINEEKRQGELLELVEEGHGSYILNAKDLCLIEYLEDLINAGISSFKIEGRAKSIYYIAVVVGAYREAINLLKSKKEKVKRSKIYFLKKELEERLTHRGYTTGFLLGLKGEQNIDKSHEKSEWEFCGEILESKKLKVKSYKILIKIHNSLKIGDEIEILRPFYDIVKLRIDKMVDVKKDLEVEEAHGGHGQVVMIVVDSDIPIGSVVRRKIN